MATTTEDTLPTSEKSLAAIYGSKIDLTLSPSDEMYDGDMRRYLRVAYSGLRLIHLSLLAAGASTPRSILDLPCGHGRMLRLLRVAFPDAEITASDLNHDAVDFCAGQFGVQGVYSASSTREIPIDRSFDLVWCGSLLTHLSEDRWPEFLEYFCARLNPGGVAVFTTHGSLTASWLTSGQYLYGIDRSAADRVLEGYRATGFGYADYQNGSEYGVSLSSIGWVHDAVARVAGWRLVACFPKAWDDHHDFWACVRV